MTTREELRAVRDVLVRARARIEDPSRWCRFGYAEDGVGNRALATDSVSTRFCALGSVIAELGADRRDAFQREIVGYLSRSSDELFGELPARVNDYRGHAAVMAIYDRAINRTLDEEAALAGVTS